MAGNKLTNYIIWSVPRSFDLPNFSSLFFFHCYSISREVSFDDSANLTYWGPHGSWKEANWLPGSLALEQVKSDLHSQYIWLGDTVNPAKWSLESKHHQAFLVSWSLALKIQEQYNGNFSERSEMPSGWWIQTVSPWRGTLAQLRLEKKNNNGQHTSPICAPLTRSHLECYSDHPKANCGMGLPKLSVHEIQASQCFNTEPERIKIPTNSSEASFLEGVKVNLSSNPIGKLMNPPNP